MQSNRNMMNRLMSIFLCVALLVSCLPSFSFPVKAAEMNRTVDPSTMDGWKEFFLPENGDLSTENAGGIWTDKSVFLDANAFGDSGIVQDNSNSFLVALSAIGSNKTITGMSQVPTDTMLVLDVSGSMDGSGSALVSAANQTIASLLSMNAYNRVGVVLYSGTRASDSNSDAAVLLLPLGRYQIGSGGIAGQYLRFSNNSVGLNPYLLDSETGKSPSTANVSKRINGATYIQKGVIEAMGQFTAESNSVTVEDPTLGTVNRMPILVLMSDGAPTLGTTEFTSPGQYNMGNGSDTSAALGFVNQLTAAYAKQQIEKKYGNQMLFYTLGLGIDNDATAVSVLDPVHTSGAIQEFWTRYNTAQEGENVLVQQSQSGPPGGNPGSSLYVKKLAQEDGEVLSNQYVDRYFSSSQASDLATAFQEIISQISLQSKFFPTLVGGDEDLSGYISFVDRIGKYMEVTDIKGLLINNQLYSGAELAKTFTSGSTDIGAQMLNAVMTRLSLESPEQAQTLIDLAYAHGQIHYTDDQNYSNYIGWYANQDGQFLGFWYEGTETMPDPNDPSYNDATRPVYIIKSYGYLGAVDAEHGVEKSDMMYATVQVRENILSGEQYVAFAVPATLIPLVTYHVTLDENGGLSNLTTSGATEPIRLVYEVALEQGINAFNVQELDADYLLANTDANGNVSFYSNQYDVAGNTGYNTVNAYSYFNPSRLNDRYYFLEDTLVYQDSSGTLYESDTAPSGTMYRRHQIYQKVDGVLSVHVGYHPLSEAILETALQTAEAQTWYIPQGSVRVSFEDYCIYKGGIHTEDPSLNETDTLIYANLPFVDHYNHTLGDFGYNYIIGATLGNNGKLTLMPETGIKLSKEMAEGAAANGSFGFQLTNLSNANDNHAYPAYLVSADAAGSEIQVQFAGGRATVYLEAGQTLYIGGMTDGQRFRIQELENEDYKVASVNGIAGTEASIVVESNAMAPAAFVNDIRSKGNLTIAKEVTHEFGTSYIIPDDKIFEITVTLEGIGAANADIRAQLTGSDLESIHTDENGSFTVSLKNDQQLELFDLPEGTVATVTESDPGAGFEAKYWDNGVPGDGVVEVVGDSTVSVIVVNDYSANEVTGSAITVGGDKLLKWYVNDVLVDYPWQADYSFNFALQKIDAQGLWQTISEDSVLGDQAEKSFNFDHAMDAEVYTAVGNYNYRIIELRDDPLDGFDYDLSVHSFTVQVADEDMDGKLEIRNVISSRESVTITPSASGWDVSASFTNLYAPEYSNQVSIEITKLVSNPTGSPEASARGFRFALFDGQTQVAVSEITNTHGITRLNLGPYAEPATYQYILREIIPVEGSAGWSYSAEAIPVTIVVEDTGDGKLVAKISQQNPSANDSDAIIYAAFTNTYDPKDAELVIDFVSKELTGRDLQAGEFSFEVRPYGGQSVVLSGSNDAQGKVNFDGKLVFDQVGVYYYDVVETSQDGKGITVDKTIYRVTVTVSDKKDGSLKASYVLVNVQGDQIVFKNSYHASPVSYIISGSKTLKGRVLLNDEFTFILQKALDAEGTIDSTVAAVEAGNFADGSIRFPAITFTEAGIYYYVVSEKDESLGQYGIRYDTTQFVVTVEITDNGEGELLVSKVSYTILGGGVVNGIAFVNEYIPEPTTAQIPGSKTLDGKVLGVGDYEFELLRSNADWEALEVLDRKSNAEDGSFVFRELSYSKADTYYYLVREVDGGKVINGVIYDNTVYRVRISVTDNLNGQLEASMVVFDQYDIPQDLIRFVNVYQISGTENVTLTGNKILTGRELQDGEFKFLLYSANEDYVPQEDDFLEAVNQDGQLSFLLEYGPEDVGITYYYVVKEENAGQTILGVTYSKAEYHISVLVEDDGIGGIQTTTNIQLDGDAVTALDFVNSYVADNTELMISGNKDLTGRPLLDSEFKFLLQAADEQFQPLADAEILEAWNDADGSFVFDALNFAEPGTYRYLVTEDASVDVERVTFDSSVYQITVVVTDNAEGKLVASEPAIRKLGEQEAAEEISFLNVFTQKPDDLPVQLDIKKIIHNKGEETIGPENFWFQMENLETGEKQTVKSDAAGAAAFGLVFKEEDAGKTFRYRISEIDDGRENVKYSKAAYLVEITVSLGEDNKLMASIRMDEAEVDSVLCQFVNEYGDSDDGPPDTADHSMMLMWVALLFVSGGCFAVLSTQLKKKED